MYHRYITQHPQRGLVRRRRPYSEVDADSAVVERIVRDTTGQPPRELRFLRTEGGLVAFLTLGLEPTSRLDEAHSRASDQ